MIKLISFSLLLSCMTMVAADKKTADIALKELNVSVENSYSKIRPIVKGGRVTPAFGNLSEVTAQDLKRIEKALDKLVKLGAFAELKVQINTSKPLAENVEEAFGQHIEKLKDKYGPYVAEEMLFSRLRRMKNPLKRGAMMKLHFRAPKEDIKFFRELFKKAGVTIEA